MIICNILNSRSDNSNLIRTENAVPNNPENNPNIKYNVPISLALVEKNHLSCHSVGCSKVKNDEPLWVLIEETFSFLVKVEKFLPIPSNILL